VASHAANRPREHPPHEGSHLSTSRIHSRDSDSGVVAAVETGGGAEGGGAASGGGLTPAVAAVPGVEVRVWGLEGIHRQRL
jgi:hypothetical protein